VWRLFGEWEPKFCPRVTIVERDQNLPALETLLAEVVRAEAIVRVGCA
jgi:uncharacterized protein (UPF0276 family)